MNNKRTQLGFALAFHIGLTTTTLAEKQFTLIGPNVVVANIEMADELRSYSWRRADGCWAPDASDVLRGLTRLQPKAGADEIMASAVAKIDMSPSLRVLAESRYQVFGLVVSGRKQILF